MAILSKEETRALLEGDYGWMLKREDDLLRELYCKIKYQGLGPKTIVEYTREPFVYAPGNVR